MPVITETDTLRKRILPYRFELATRCRAVRLLAFRDGYTPNVKRPAVDEIAFILSITGVE